MYRTGSSAVGLFGAVLLFASMGSAEVAGEGGQGSPLPHKIARSSGNGENGEGGQGSPLPHKGEVINSFLAEHPSNNFYYSGGRIDRVYGPAFSSGNSVQASAEAFRLSYSGMWGVPANEVVPVWPYGDGQHLQGIMYNPDTQQYKFFGAFYTQQRAGIPVFRSKLVLLVRNEPGYPLVLATSSLRDLGAFDAAAALQTVKPNVAATQVRNVMGGAAEITPGSLVIWAGVDELNATPRLAFEYQAETVGADVDNYQKWLFLVDAATGEVLFQESMIHTVDISGNVSGMATTGYAADVCSGIASMPLPYAKVTAGATTVYTDINGNYVLPNAGSSPVSVTSTISGLYFDVFNFNGTSTAGPPTSITQSITPPGPGNFVHNQANTSAFNRAEVNCYIHANIVRDYILAHDPTYPVIASQTGFDVNVNRNATCNAFYNGSSINFYIAGGGCSNTGNSTVVYHEYGHHVVETGGSGQGAYGEGMADCISIIVSDDHCLGNGFQSCGTCLRSGINNCQYVTSGCSSCGSAIHTCGQILSGCIWKLRNNLMASDPVNYREVLASLTIGSVRLHTGTSITPSITVDFLTLDDNDSDISNGTPHYSQINSAFSAHNMPGPPLAALLFAYPNGKPDFIAPGGGTTMRVAVSGNAATPQPNTGKLHVSTGGPYTEYPMTQISPNVYDAVFPAFPCGTAVRYYVSAQTTASQTVTSPTNAPTTYFTAPSAVGVGATVFTDNFQSDLGWTISNSGGLTAGAWQRAVPRTDCVRGNPLQDQDGSGMCYLTQNSDGPAGDICNSDVDGGSTTLTSPMMNASQGAYVLSYARWFTNLIGANTPDQQDDVFIVDFSINGGSTWTNLETVGPLASSPNPVQLNTWVTKSFVLNSLPGFTPTTQFRVRFIAQDLGTGSVVEAGIDNVKLITLNCSNPCPADVNGDSLVNVNDMLAVINAWGTCNGCPADVNGDGNVNVNDMLAVLNAWGACP